METEILGIYIIGFVLGINNGILMSFGWATSLGSWVQFPISYINPPIITLGTRPTDSEGTVGRTCNLNKSRSASQFIVYNNGWSNNYVGLTCDWISIGH